MPAILTTGFVRFGRCGSNPPATDAEDSENRNGTWASRLRGRCYRRQACSGGKTSSGWVYRTANLCLYVVTIDDASARRSVSKLSDPRTEQPADSCSTASHDRLTSGNQLAFRPLAKRERTTVMFCECFIIMRLSLGDRIKGCIQSVCPSRPPINSE